eukprot:XP_001698479.1 predicted protein [Chlamydomonas reinhardtii]
MAEPVYCVPSEVLFRNYASTPGPLTRNLLLKNTTNAQLQTVISYPFSPSFRLHIPPEQKAELRSNPPHVVLELGPNSTGRVILELKPPEASADGSGPLGGHFQDELVVLFGGVRQLVVPMRAVHHGLEGTPAQQSALLTRLAYWPGQQELDARSAAFTDDVTATYPGITPAPPAHVPPPPAPTLPLTQQQQQPAGRPGAGGVGGGPDPADPLAAAFLGMQPGADPQHQQQQAPAALVGSRSGAPPPMAPPRQAVELPPEGFSQADAAEAAAGAGPDAGQAGGGLRSAGKAVFVLNGKLYDARGNEVDPAAAAVGPGGGVMVVDCGEVTTPRMSRPSSGRGVGALAPLKHGGIPVAAALRPGSATGAAAFMGGSPGPLRQPPAPSSAAASAPPPADDPLRAAALAAAMRELGITDLPTPSSSGRPGAAALPQPHPAAAHAQAGGQPDWPRLQARGPQPPLPANGNMPSYVQYGLPPNYRPSICQGHQLGYARLARGAASSHAAERWAHGRSLAQTSSGSGATEDAVEGLISEIRESLQNPDLKLYSLALLDQLKLSYASTAATCGDPDVQIHIVYALHNMMPMSVDASKWAASNNNRLLNETKTAAALARLNNSGSVSSGIDVAGGSKVNKTTGKLIQPSLPYNIIVDTVVQDRMPSNQTNVHWFSFGPAEPDGSQGRVVAYDDFQSYYVGLWDWTRGNGTVIFDYEARPVGQLPIGLDPLPFEREPLTWMTTLYRKDWLAAARALVSTPASGGARTQQQQAPVEGRDMDGDGQPDHGLCLDLARGCKLWSLLSAVYASMAQTEGRAQGVWFDTGSMTPLLDNPAMTEALALVRRLAAQSWPPADWDVLATETGTGNVINGYNGGGSWAWTDGGGTAGPTWTQSDTTGTTGGGGSGLTMTDPNGTGGSSDSSGSSGGSGSTGDGEEDGPDVIVDSAGDGGSTSGASGSSSPAYSSQSTPGAPPRRNFNTTGGFNPSGGIGSSGTIAYDNPQDPPTTTDGGSSSITGSTLETTSGNTGDMCPPVNPHFKAGKCLFTIDWAHVLSYLTMPAAPRLAGRLGVAAAPGSDRVWLRPPPSQPPAEYFKELQSKNPKLNRPDAAIINGTANSTANGSTGGVTSGHRLLQQAAGNASAPNTTALAATLVSCNATGRCRGFNIATNATNATNASSPVNRVPLTAVAGFYLLQGEPRQMTARQSDAVYEVLHELAYGLLTPYEGLVKGCRTYGAARSANASATVNLTAAAGLHPADWPGVCDTLLALEAGSATWGAQDLGMPHSSAYRVALDEAAEMLPAEVMNTCLSIHHEEVRRALEAHGGYEASTEGDAFIIAFHSAAAALAFSVELQHRLLDADWPPLLLGTADGSEVWAAPNPQNQLQQRQQAQTSYAATEAVGEQQQQQEQAASPVMPAAASTAGADNRQGPQQSLGASSGLWWGAVTRGLRQATGGTQRAGASAADAADSGNSRGPSSFGSNSSSRPLASAASQEVRGAPQLLGPAGPVAEAAEHTADADAAAIAAGSGQAHTRVDSGVLSACGHVNQAVVAQALSEPSPCAPQQAQPAQPAQPGAVEQAVGSEVRRGSPVSPQQVGAAPDVAPPALHSAPQCAEYVGVEAGAEGTNIRMGSRGHLPRWRSGQHLQQLHSASGAALLEDGSSPFTVAGAAGFGLHGDAGATATRTVGCGSSAAGGAGDESMRLALATAVFGAGGNNAGLGRVGGFRRLPFMSAHAGGFGGGGPDNERLSGAFRAGDDLPVSGPLRTSAYNGQGYATGHHHHHHTGQQHHTHTSNTLAHQTSRFLTRLRGDSSTSGAAGEGVGRDSEPRGQLELLLNKLLTAASMGRIPAANLMATFQQLWSAVQAPEEPCDPHAPLQVLSNSANSLIEDGVAVSPILALRGMRVRIGMHSGVAPSEVVETARGCCEYRGAVLARAKAVCDMAGGGVTLLTEATHAAYRLGRHKLPLIQVLHVGSPLGSPAAAAPPIGAGDASVRPRAASCRFVPQNTTAATPKGAAAGAAGAAYDGPASPSGATPECAGVAAGAAPQQSQELLCVTDARLLPRHGLVSPFRPGYYLEPLSSLAAPLGDITAAFIYVSGVKALRQWDAAVLVEAMALLHATINRTVAAAGGYVVAQAAEGMSLVVFPGSGAEAVAWAVELQEAALELPWPAALLEHDYGEEVWRDGSVVLRGLRLRVGLETGPATARLVPRTGRLDYTGRTLNRASRIASKAAAGTVLISSGLWKRALAVANTAAHAASVIRELVGSSQGRALLKGVPDLVELVQVERPRLLPLAALEELEQLLRRHSSRLAPLM